MNTLFHKIKTSLLSGGLRWALLPVLVFLAFQLLGGLIMAAGIALGVSHEIFTTLFALILIVSGLLTVLVLHKGLKMFSWNELTDLKNAFPQNNNITVFGILGALSGIFATNLLSELFDLPNIVEDQIIDLARNPLGIVSMAIVGPVIEEVVFRGAVLGNMLKNGVNPWRAMWISAILFGLVHGNPAQVPFAIVTGLILAIIYYKTGNIILTSIVHVLNNSMAVVQVLVMGDAVRDFTLTRWMGGQTNACVAMIVLYSICFFSMRSLTRSARRDAWLVQETSQREGC